MVLFVEVAQLHAQVVDAVVPLPELLLHFRNKLVLLDFDEVQRVHFLVHLGFQPSLEDFQLPVALVQKLAQSRIFIEQVRIVLQNRLYFVLQVVCQALLLPSLTQLAVLDPVLFGSMLIVDATPFRQLFLPFVQLVFGNGRLADGRRQAAARTHACHISVVFERADFAHLSGLF